MQYEPPQQILRWANLPECESPVERWRVKRFTDIAKVIAGQSPPSETYNEKGDGLPFLQGNADFSFKNPIPKLWCNSPVKMGKTGDILISVRAPVGQINLADQDYAIGRGLAAIRAVNANPDFVYQALQRWRWSLQRVAQGTTFDAVTTRHFSQLRVAIPENIDEQAAIARILGAVDTVIERTREAVERAATLQTSLLADVFQRMDAKLRKLGEFATDVRYGTSQASSERGWGNPVLRIPNVIGNQLKLNDLAYVDLRPVDIDRLFLRDGDLLLVRTNGNPNYVGRSVVFRSPDERAWVYASYLIRVRLNEGLLPDYVSVFLEIETGRRELLRRVTTSAGNHNINSNSIRLISIPVPKNKEDQEYVIEIACKYRMYITVLKQKLSALLELKKSLMHDLLTGKVRVGDNLPVLIKETIPCKP